MKQIFNLLYSVHPWLPAIYMLFFCIGLLAPALYSFSKKIPFSISLIWINAKKKELAAIVTIFFYGFLVFTTSIIFLIIIFK